MSGSGSASPTPGGDRSIASTSRELQAELTQSDRMPQTLGPSTSRDHTENEGDKSEKRERRKATLSAKGKESKASTLSLEILKKMNSQYKFLNQIQQDMCQGLTVDALIEIVAEFDARIESISGLYKDILQFNDNDESKINANIKTRFDHFLRTFENFRDTIDEQIDSATEEESRKVQEEIDEMNRELDTEVQTFLELERQRGENRATIIRKTTHEITPHKADHTAGDNRSASSTEPETMVTNTTDTTSQVESITVPQHSVVTSETVVNEQPSAELNVIAQLAQSLSAVMGTNKKTIEPIVFTGNVLDFADWEIDLELYFRNERIEGNERLRYMKKFIDGEARKCVEGHLVTNTNDAYLEARKTLKERFGNEHNITRNFRKKLADWPKIPTMDGKKLREYSDFLCHLESAMKSFKQLKVLDDYVENERMVEKIPKWLKFKWARVVDKVGNLQGRYPRFEEFSSFLKEEARIMTLPISQQFNDQTNSNKETNQNSRAKERNYSQRGAMRSYLTSNEPEKCLFCDLSNHVTADCYRLQELPKTEKIEFMKKNGLCFKCVKPNHRSKDCINKRKCRICEKPHATVNHDTNWKPREWSKPTSTKRSDEMDQQGNQTLVTEKVTKPQITATTKLLNCHATGLKNSITSMAVPVYISAGTDRELLTYALLDNQSDASYISNEVFTKLKLNNDRIHIERDVVIHTMNGAKMEDIVRCDEIIVRSYRTDDRASISAYKRDNIYCNREQLPSPTKARKLDHLRDIAELMPPLLDIPVGLLIGMDYPEIIQPLETRPAAPGKTGKPFGIKTIFGWTMCGGSTVQKQEKSTYKADTTRDTQLLNLMERDFRDIGHDELRYTSQDDLKFLQIMNTSIKQNCEGNYIMPLPFRQEPDLPSNRSQAEKRLLTLIKRFRTDTDYYNEYKKFMDDLIKAGHAELVISEGELGKVWYLPHFGVRHKQKNKLRVVFDASAKFRNTAINDYLLSGPDQINSLLGILLRFRRELIAITCDIQQMFFNFLVNIEHRDYLRFLWINEDLTVKEYRMTAHLFGAKSSPGIATFGLKRLAEDYQTISSEAAQFIQEDFYVDDGVTSVASPEQATSIIKAAMEICSKANIRLHKFYSNSIEVLSTVPESERGESTKNLNIFEDQLPSQRTLGMEWCLDSDTFRFTTPVIKDKPTKRMILSTVAKIYDPMGFISPVILKGKQILQRVTVAERSWDQIISPDDELEWKKWTETLNHLSELHIPRCFKAKGNLITTELHHFSDASLLGYGACSYIRQINDKGEITCRLVLSKSRVAPLKKLTIPRLELQGAVTAVRLSKILEKELKVSIDRQVFWTDSKIVLGYIANEIKRFHIYVANRVSEIKQATITDQWHYVPTEQNPADITSRGATVQELIRNLTWFEGPEFLKQSDLNNYIIQNQTKPALSDDDPDVRKPKVTTLATSTTTNMVQRFNKYSDWNKLLRSIAILRGFAKRKTWKLSNLVPASLNEAERFVIRSVQLVSYPSMEKEESLSKLNPRLDEHGIIQVGGRAMATGEFTDLFKHPTVIPKHSHISYLIAKHHHEKIYHLGRRSTLASIREAGYWLVNGTSAVKSLINKCVSCSKLRKPTETQLMGNLPKERLEKTPPFTHIAMDAFGPFYVKERRSELKRWGLLITCLYSRAVHIEILEDMTTDTLIQALRCFMAVRGPVTTIICDNGTNFVGMNSEISKELDRSSDNMKHYLLQNKIQFKFNSPNASNQNGVTERLIRSIRAVLNGMALNLKNRFDTKTLRTVFYEAANIVNNRPIATNSLNDPEQHVITPNHLLTMKTKALTAPPPGEFPSEELYSTKRWKVSQHIVQQFWKAWKSEYIDTIMTAEMDQSL